MLKKNPIDVELMRERFSYNPDTGDLLRLKSTKYRWRSGILAGTTKDNGYKVVTVNGSKYGAHRVAWTLYYGVHPTGVIDHINGNPSDNRIVNLRDVSQNENMQNRKTASSNSKTGLLVVAPRGNGFVATLLHENKQHYVGVFKTAQEAYSAYLNAKASIHKGFVTP